MNNITFHRIENRQHHSHIYRYMNTKGYMIEIIPNPNKESPGSFKDGYSYIGYLNNIVIFDNNSKWVPFEEARIEATKKLLEHIKEDFVITNSDVCDYCGCTMSICLKCAQDN